MMKPVAQFTIEYQQFLDADGVALGELPALCKNPEILQQLYRELVLARTFDLKAINLQRTGKMGTYAACFGQEAIPVGIGHAMKKDDVYVSSYRDYATLFKRGIKMSEVLLYWGGDERGNNYSVGNLDFPLCVPIGTQCLHASGIATAMKIRHEKRAVVVTVGDGGTSEGDFYEAINVAGAWQLPVVFVICNNQWAISMSRTKQTAAQTLAQKAIAAGIDSHQIDGNDVIAVVTSVEAALQQAREKSRPYLIEALTYRLHDHTTADDATRYRDNQEIELAKRQEPIVRLRKFLTQQNWWQASEEEALLSTCQQQVESAVQEYLSTPPDNIGAIFNSLYAKLPELYWEQREAALNQGECSHE